MMMKKISAEILINQLGLETLPKEGGHFKQTYKSDETVCIEAPGTQDPHIKPRSTAIFYMLSSGPDSFSAIHKLPTVEIYHFYLGDPVELLLLKGDGGSEVIVLGQDILYQQHVQFVVPAGIWQGSRLIPGGEFALLGTTMAPGFVDEDFIAGERESLISQYPDHSELITSLT